MKKNAELQKKTVLRQMHMKKKKIQAGHMIMNKDTAVNTCNACNETLRKIQYLKKHIKAENV